MSKFTGTIRKNDLEGGFWQLVADDGTAYQLQGGDEGLRKEGLVVEVQGAVEEQMMGIGMSGPILRVDSYSTK